MGGKKGQTHPVNDHHLSIDYGLCHGPLDHLNKIWVKDKGILCDMYAERTDIEVHQPDLFGGDDAEGGVSGVVEYYPGDDTQTASHELAIRPGLNTQTMPGYRGIAHLFFRGFRNWEKSEAEELSAVGFLVNTLRNLLDGVARPSVKRGFKWSANNPYLPAIKANVTRLSGGADDPLRAIWPLGSVFQDAAVAGEALTLSPILDSTSTEYALAQPGLVLDLFAFGATQLQIDNGEVLLAVSWLVELESWIATSGQTTRTAVRFYATQPTAWDQVGIDPVAGQDVDVTSAHAVSDQPGEPGLVGYATSEIPTVTAPAGCRYVQIMAKYDPGGAFARHTSGSYAVAVAEPLPVVETETSEGLFNVPINGDKLLVSYGEIEVKSIVPSRMGEVVDLLALGLTEFQIDSGLLTADAAMYGAFWSGIGALPSSDTQVKLAITFHKNPLSAWYDSSLDLIPGEDDGRAYFSDFFRNQVDATVGIVDEITIPPLTRFVQIRAAVGSRVGLYYLPDENRVPTWRILKRTYGAVWCMADGSLGPLPDANPAFMVEECMTNPDWGKGEDPSLIDTDSIQAAAQTLFAERMGMSLTWYAQAKMDEFIGEILDHIQGFLYQDPASGLWTLKLLRDDYDVATLRTLDESNCVATNRKRRLWGETINEIVVSYTDPNTEKGATVSSHDLGNIAIQGGIISETRDYHGFRNPFIAQVVADRDVRAAGYPLFSCQIKVDRSEWNAKPGDVRKFSWPEDGIDQIVVRVMAVDTGKPGDRKIVLDVTEDIFSIEQAEYSAPQQSQWTNGAEAPTPLAVQTAITIPLPLLLRSGTGLGDLDADYPNVPVAVLADAIGLRPSSVEVNTSVVQPNGASAVQKTGAISVTLSGRITTPLVAEAESRFPAAMVEGIMRTVPSGGEFLMLGVSELESELVMLDSYDEAADEWVTARGMWDTVPLDWPAGTRLWVFGGASTTLDPRQRSAGESVEYTLLPTTSLGSLAYADAVPFTATFTERPFAPFRPAAAELDGLGFGGVIQREAPFPTSVIATWATRNRASEDQVAARWSEGDAAVEVGQTTVLRVLDAEGVMHQEITGLTGTSQEITVSLFPPTLEGYIEFVSERDGIRSVLGARRYFDIRPPTGYGLAYGLGYGGGS